MKKIIIILSIFALLFNMIYPISIFANNEAKSIYLNIKIGKSYEENSPVTISADTELSVYSVDNLNAPLYKYANSISVIKSTNDVYLNSKLSEVDLLTGKYVIGSQENNISISGSKYRGYVSFRINDNKLDIVNYVEIEDYIKGVVPKEVSPSFPEEALKAQAVASRSFAISNKNKFIKYGYNLQDGTNSQVYKGMSVEDKRTNKACDDTRGIYAIYNGRVATTIFHASSGGFTESAHILWGGDKNCMIGKFDAYSENSRSSTWEYSISKVDFQKKLDAAGKSVGIPVSISFDSFMPSGRIQKMTINGNKGSVSMTGEALRFVLGSMSLKSSLFDIGILPVITPNSTASFSNNNQNLTAKNIDLISGTEFVEFLLAPNSLSDIRDNDVKVDNGAVVNREVKVVSLPDNIIFMGRGYGHGAGMSQYGAEIMAKEGKKYDEILKFYYTGIELGAYCE